MRYNAFFSELPLNAFKPRPGGGMTFEGGGNPISAVTDAVNSVVSSAGNAVGDVVNTVGNAGQSVIDTAKDVASTDLGKAAILGAGAYYGLPELTDAVAPAVADVATPAVADVVPLQASTAFTGELPAQAAYTAPAVTTLGDVAGTTEGLASGTALSDLGATENAYTAAQDAQDALAMTGNPAANASLTGVGAIGAANAYPALNAAAAGDVAAAGGTTAAALKAAGLGAAGAAGGTALADILPYTTGASVVGSLLSANAAQNAADTQSAAAQQAIAQQQKNFDLINKQQVPYRGAGYQGLNAIRAMLPGQYMQYDENGNAIGQGIGTDYLTHQFNASDLAAGLAPNYDFMLKQGQMANQRAANAGGGGIGGNALQGLQKYTQDYAGNAYQNAFNNYQSQRKDIYNTLANIAGIGQTGQTAANTAGTNLANAASQLGVGSAAAQAAGQTGAANAYTNAINQGVNNYTLASLLGQRGNVQLPIA